MKIDLTYKQILHYAEIYADYDNDEEITAQMKCVTKRRYMTLDDLIVVAKWKSPRVQPQCRRNSEDEIREITEFSFATESEFLRINVLRLLKGVEWPMASVILHFAIPDKYPILDYRAMNTVGGDTKYTFKKWMEYVLLCQNTIAKHEINMRTLDRALWAYDKCHEKKTK